MLKNQKKFRGLCSWIHWPEPFPDPVDDNRWQSSSFALPGRGKATLLP
jgi:hypothetical protein